MPSFLLNVSICCNYLRIQATWVSILITISSIIHNVVCLTALGCDIWPLLTGDSILNKNGSECPHTFFWYSFTLSFVHSGGSWQNVPMSSPIFSLSTYEPHSRISNWRLFGSTFTHSFFCSRPPYHILPRGSSHLIQEDTGEDSNEENS